MTTNWADETTIDRLWNAAPRLTPAEEQELAHRIQGDDPEDARIARDALITANLRLVAMVAKKVKRRRGVSAHDVISDGCLGLVVAAGKYRAGRVRFGTYAVHWIRAAIGATRRKNTLVHVPAYLYDLIAKEDRGEALTKDQRERTAAARVAMVAAAGGTTDRHGHEPVPRGEDIDGCPPPWQEAEDREEVEHALRHMPAVERDVITRRFWRNETLQRVGKDMGITHEWVRQHERRGLERIRAMVAN